MAGRSPKTRTSEVIKCISKFILDFNLSVIKLDKECSMEVRSTLICVLFISAFLTACGTTSHYGKRPNFSQISMGVSQAEIIQILGKPDDMSAIDGTVYLNYIYTPWYDHNGADGKAEHYFVRLVGDKVDSFGRKGDFNTTKDPEQTININVKQE